jgi:hypothetical protein
MGMCMADFVSSDDFVIAVCIAILAGFVVLGRILQYLERYVHRSVQQALSVLALAAFVIWMALRCST